MPTFDTPLELYKHQKAAFDATQRSAKQAYRQIGEGTFRDLRELTSGSISTAQLRRMGHPYAKTANGTARGVSKSYVKRNNLESRKGLAPLLPVNRQSGRLQKSLKIVRRSSQYAAEDSVFFDPQIAGSSLWAIAPQGTRYVVARGVWVEASKNARVRQRAYRDRFFKDQLDAFKSPTPSARTFTVLDPL